MKVRLPLATTCSCTSRPRCLRLQPKRLSERARPFPSLTFTAFGAFGEAASEATRRSAFLACGLASFGSP